MGLGSMLVLAGIRRTEVACRSPLWMRVSGQREVCLLQPTLQYEQLPGTPVGSIGHLFGVFWGFLALIVGLSRL